MASVMKVDNWEKDVVLSMVDLDGLGIPDRCETMVEWSDLAAERNCCLVVYPLNPNSSSLSVRFRLARWGGSNLTLRGISLSYSESVGELASVFGWGLDGLGLELGLDGLGLELGFVIVGSEEGDVFAVVCPRNLAIASAWGLVCKF